MKRYMLFGFPDYEASGGMNDFINSFDTVDEVLYCAESRSDDNLQMYDLNENKKYKLITTKKLIEE